MYFFIVVLILNLEAVFALMFYICSNVNTEPCFLSDRLSSKGISFCFQPYESLKNLTISSQANSEYFPWELEERVLFQFDTFITVTPDQLIPNDWNQVTLKLNGQSYDAPCNVMLFSYTVNDNKYSVKVPVYENTSYSRKFPFKYSSTTDIIFFFYGEWIGSRNFTSSFDSSGDKIYSGNGSDEDNDEDTSDLLTNCDETSTPVFSKTRDTQPEEIEGSLTTTYVRTPTDRAFGLSPKDLLTLCIVIGIILAMICSIISILIYKRIKRRKLRHKRNEPYYYKDLEYDDPVKRPVSLGVNVNHFLKTDVDPKKEDTEYERDTL